MLKYLYDYVVNLVTPPVMSDVSDFELLNCLVQSLTPSHTYPLDHLFTLLQTVPSVPTLFHCAALTNQGHIVDYLRQISYPPTKRCKRIIDKDRNVLVSHACFNLNQLNTPCLQISRDELAEEVAAVKGLLPLRGTIAAYRMVRVINFHVFYIIVRIATTAVRKQIIVCYKGLAIIFGIEKRHDSS